MRIDYLAPATGEELVAEAELVRNGDGVAAVESSHRRRGNDGGDRGTYKTGGEEGGARREDDATK